ncbi:farnesol dehydrogenase-like [Chrysoperla carnea]|uniref:farnesol dehydrogenase-like n=1 Tax=Chrysoperla carnea TaxID=189513 RepID=UPI001D06E31D|nr:farnesol dehydrogenase-like [Chrysoperla carnea]
MENYVGKVAVITGSSAGIGATISKELVKRGMKVVGLARRLERLEDLKKQLSNESGQFYSLQCDIRNEKEILNAFEWVEKNLGGVDVLVNNAGLMQITTLSDGDIEKWKTVLDTNVLGLCIATREAVKSMKKRAVSGHIIHINSLAGHRVVPQVASTFNVYFASKFAVRALAETLRFELAHSKLKIKVCNISPGYVEHTEFLIAGGATEIPEFVKNASYLIPENIAEAVVYVLSTPPNVDVSD